MASPITASDFDLVSLSGDVCERLRKLLELNNTMKVWFTWAFNPDGTATEEFKLLFRDIATPVGGVIWRPLPTIPEGYLQANGAAVSRTTYANLFAVYGTTFGSGDLSTTFNLPNLYAKYLMGAGAGSSYPVGTTGGEENHTLTLSEIPAHTHTYSKYSPGPPAVDDPVDGSNNDGGYTVEATGTAGSGQAHNNLPPFMAGLWLVKT